MEFKQHFAKNAFAMALSSRKTIMYAIPDVQVARSFE